MIKYKTQYSNKVKVPVATRKPSLPTKRNLSISSNYSCLSDRIYDNNYKKGECNPVQPTKSNPNLNPVPCQEKDADKQNQKHRQRIKCIDKIKEKSKESKQPKAVSSRSNHMLTGFQWLLILRYCYYKNNKKSNKKRTLIDYVSNRLYPDSIWNSIRAYEYEGKFSSEEIVELIKQEGKMKMNVDDLLVCLSKLYRGTNQEQHESAAETARFVEQMKPEQQRNARFVEKMKPEQQRNPRKQFINPSKPLIKSNPSHAMPMTMDSLDMDQFSIDVKKIGSQLISPISIIDQSNNNVSFSIEDSSMNSQYSTNKITEKFQFAFSSMQSFLKDLQTNCSEVSVSSDKKLLISFVQEILNYSNYKMKTTNFGSAAFFYGLKISPNPYSQPNPPNSSHNSRYRQILKKLFSSEKFTEYFKLFTAIKVSQRPEELHFITNSLCWQRIRILNLANNNIKSLQFMRGFLCPANNSLQLLNLNSNHLTNISELLSLCCVEQLYLKKNKIDHVTISKDKFKANSLKIIDLGYNKIQRQADLSALALAGNLKMLNLYGNKILENQEKQRCQLFKDRKIIGNYPELYFFSDFISYKDIAFESKQNRSNTLSTSRSHRKSIN